MSLQIGEAVRDGFERTVRRNGLLLVGLFAGFGLINTVVRQSLLAAMRALSAQSGAVSQPPFQSPNTLAVPIPWPVSLLLLLLFALVAETLRVVAVRTFAGSQTQTIPEEATRDLPATVLNAFIAGVITSVAIALGTVALILPGIFLSVSLFFVRQEVAIGERNAVDALSGSWRLAKGNRLSILGLAAVLFVAALAAGTPGLLLRLVSPAAGAILTTVLGSVVSVFGIAVVTRAYEQLRGPSEQYL